jgi:glycoside/pentoside/hexuronide:cation symporter, GPH family
MFCLFYIFFTAYVNPYLALISELGHTGVERINLSTLIAFSGLTGMVLVTVGLPELVGRWQQQGMDFRESFLWAVAGVSLLALVMLYLATFSFAESRHCFAVTPTKIRTWESLQRTFSLKPFRIFIMGEVCMQFAMNLTTLGMMYYAVVLFQREQRFMSVLAGLVLGAAFVSFPLVNIAAKKVGKRKVISAGAFLLTLCTTVIFILSFNLTGMAYYISLVAFALAGVPLAILAILVNPTIADLARSAALQEGQGREAMFFGARAIPLKLSIALAGVFFAYLLSSFGKDIESPLGVQLSVLAVALASFGGYCFFACYPEKEVQASLKAGERNS